MSRPCPARRVWIDTDPAVGVPGCDVDDGYALVQALHSPELEVVGISTVFGNAPLDVAHDVATELVSVAGADVPLHRGAASAEEMGTPSPASEALAEALSDGPLSVLALGPLTNVATTLQTRPESARHLVEVVAVAGRRPGQRFLVAGRGPLPDFNFECDPAAAETLLAARDVPVTLAGFEVATHALVTPTHVARLRRGPPAARWLAERTGSWLDLWAEHFSTAGFHPFDTLAVGAVLAPSLLCTEPMETAVVRVAAPELDHRGNQGPPLQLHAAPSLPSGRPARYASTAGPGFVDDLMARLLAA
ncbi:MAG: nucleoside hydrolase [Actinomycetota bacterium]|jgi:inosine-uridine nucleoside N-ribohydrolase|nr:nucleoside hydrolase [Actinomycetota bacterium]